MRTINKPKTKKIEQQENRKLTKTIKTIPLGSDAEPGRNPEEERGGGEESQAGRNRSYAGVRFPCYRTGKIRQGKIQGRVKRRWTLKIRQIGKISRTFNIRRTGKISLTSN